MEGLSGVYFQDPHPWGCECFAFSEILLSVADIGAREQGQGVWLSGRAEWQPGKCKVLGSAPNTEKIQLSNTSVLEAWTSFLEYQAPGLGPLPLKEIRAEKPDSSPRCPVAQQTASPSSVTCLRRHRFEPSACPRWTLPLLPSLEPPTHLSRRQHMFSDTRRDFTLASGS